MATASANVLHQTTQEDSIVIRSEKNDMVLTASSDSVFLERYNSSSSAQIWLVQSTLYGKIIVNVSNRKVLDVEGGAKTNNWITISRKGESTSQFWNINPDGTITNAGTNLALDVNMCNKLKLYPKHGKANQRFPIQLKNF
ncbi:hypothetical protein Zmor_002117 [Zophobas morio]|uniref:Ricin B lectin domain-containing protein n=1 Tax=Zophobas morio TaxID=2755281 RepID=A0AA38MTI8_9CUCU|nr:hypothetical protein Zmor_002117 [Zophobas morio]